jgi:hypothetical protein
MNLISSPMMSQLLLNWVPGPILPLVCDYQLYVRNEVIFIKLKTLSFQNVESGYGSS